MYSIKAKGNARGEIFIYEDIGDGWFGGIGADQFRKDLRALGDVKQIDVRINSYGGDVFDGLTIHRLLVEHAAQKTVHVDGIAASIAAVIAMAGNKIVINEAGFMMIHDAWGLPKELSADGLRKHADRLDAASDQIANVYAKRTGLAHDDVRDLMRAETWLTAADAKEKGFATEVTMNEAVAAHCLADAAKVYEQHQQRFSKPVPDVLRHPLKEAARARLTLIK